MSCPGSHKAAVLYGAKDLRIQDIDTPSLKSHEVQISPRATGICGTDQHYYQNGRNGIYQVKEPLILGHEGAGQVVAVGSDVVGIKVGDRVAFEPQLCCSACEQCRSGRYNLCPKMRFNGSASASPPAQGSLQERLNHPADLCYKLPDSMSFAEAALIEPLSVALHSVRKAGLKAGQTVLITGGGAIGLLCARVAKVSGASSVSIVDVDEARLNFAKEHKIADETFLIPLSAAEGESSSDFAARMANQLAQQLSTGVSDVSLECTGVETCINVCINSTAPGGKIIVVGMGRPLQNLSLGVALVKEVQLVPVWRYTNTFRPAIALIEAGLVDVRPMITHCFRMEDAVKALELALERPPDLIKCVITSEQ